MENSPSNGKNLIHIEGCSPPNSDDTLDEFFANPLMRMSSSSDGMSNEKKRKRKSSPQYYNCDENSTVISELTQITYSDNNNNNLASDGNIEIVTSINDPNQKVEMIITKKISENSIRYNGSVESLAGFAIKTNDVMQIENNSIENSISNSNFTTDESSHHSLSNNEVTCDNDTDYLSYNNIYELDENDKISMVSSPKVNIEKQQEQKQQEEELEEEELANNSVTNTPMSTSSDLKDFEGGENDPEQDAEFEQFFDNPLLHSGQESVVTISSKSSTIEEEIQDMYTALEQSNNNDNTPPEKNYIKKFNIISKSLSGIRFNPFFNSRQSMLGRDNNNNNYNNNNTNCPSTPPPPPSEPKKKQVTISTSISLFSPKPSPSVSKNTFRRSLDSSTVDLPDLRINSKPQVPKFSRHSISTAEHSSKTISTSTLRERLFSLTSPTKAKLPPQTSKDFPLSPNKMEVVENKHGAFPTVGFSMKKLAFFKTHVSLTPTNSNNNNNNNHNDNNNNHEMTNISEKVKILYLTLSETLKAYDKNVVKEAQKRKLSFAARADIATLKALLEQQLRLDLLRAKLDHKVYDKITMEDVEEYKFLENEIVRREKFELLSRDDKLNKLKTAAQKKEFLSLKTDYERQAKYSKLLRKERTFENMTFDEKADWIMIREALEAENYAEQLLKKEHINKHDFTVVEQVELLIHKIDMEKFQRYNKLIAKEAKEKISREKGKDFSLPDRSELEILRREIDQSLKTYQDKRMDLVQKLKRGYTCYDFTISNRQHEKKLAQYFAKEVLVTTKPSYYDSYAIFPEKKEQEQVSPMRKSNNNNIYNNNNKSTLQTLQPKTAAATIATTTTTAPSTPTTVTKSSVTFTTPPPKTDKPPVEQTSTSTIKTMTSRLKPVPFPQVKQQPIEPIPQPIAAIVLKPVLRQTPPTKPVVPVVEKRKEVVKVIPNAQTTLKSLEKEEIQTKKTIEPESDFDSLDGMLTDSESINMPSDLNEIDNNFNENITTKCDGIAACTPSSLTKTKKKTKGLSVAKNKEKNEERVKRVQERKSKLDKLLCSPELTN